MATRARHLTHPYLARVWAKGGRGPACAGAGTGQEDRHAGVRSITSRANSSSTSPEASAAAISSPISSNLDRLCGPRPANSPSRWSSSRTIIDPHEQALDGSACRPLTVEWLPKYAELNDIEVGLARPQGVSPGLAHQTFAGIDAPGTRRSTCCRMNSTKSARCFRWSNHESLLRILELTISGGFDRRPIGPAPCGQYPCSFKDLRR